MTDLQIAKELWSLLDNIDTLDDAARGDDAFFRRGVRKYLRARHFYLHSDGYELRRATIDEAKRAVEAAAEAAVADAQKQKIMDVPQKKCATCSGPGPFRPPTPPYTWNDTCAWCADMIIRRDRPADPEELLRGPSPKPKRGSR